MKNALAELIQSALETLVKQNVLPEGELPPVQIENTRDASHGDLASNVALSLAKRAGQPPRELAAAIRDALPPSPLIAQVDIAGPGFLNFHLSADSQQAVVRRVIEQGNRYGHSDAGAGRKVQVEFVSANPTGPLHVGHGRGAAVGDCLCRLLQATGWDVSREFYYNDAGQQIENLALSVQARCQGVEPDSAGWPDDGYRGDYITELGEAFKRGESVASEDRKVTASGDVTDLDSVREFAVAWLRREQDLDLKAFAVSFDSFFLESSLYNSGEVEAVVQRLVERGQTYEQDGALWLKTTDFGDDKDRVMRKREGGYTYFLPDVAYHLNKWRRGFTRAIDEQGADHHSTVTRVRAGLQALDEGIPEGWPEYVLHQMVTVMRDGEEVKLSKRAGSYVTLRDLIDEVGCDATRFFLAARAPNSQLTFDIDLALSQSNDNPVYYVQYAHARICSVLAKLQAATPDWQLSAALEQLATLQDPQEQALMRQLERFPEVVERAATQSEPHSVANYLRELAADFHTWYNAQRVLVDDAALRDGRAALSVAVRQVIANGLSLLGVSAPESM